MRYETGLFLTEAEFNVEQQYHMRMRRLHNRHLHTAGIVWGLDLIAHPGTYRVDIQPGMALDVYFDNNSSEELSREIVVPVETTVDLTTANYAPNSSIYLWIQYAEEEADASVNAGGQGLHWLESFAVGHSLVKPDDERQNVILGKVILDATGKVSTVELLENGISLRLYAGFLGKSVETDRLILSDDAISESFPYLDGTLFLPDGSQGNGIPGIDIHSSLTHMTGDMEVGGSLTVKGSSAKINTDRLSAKESVVTLNDGESGSGVTGRYAGLRVLRGLLDAVRMVYDESDDRWKVGPEGLEETLALLSDVYTRTQLDALFSGQSAAGKKQVEWTDILNKIDAYTKTEINSFFSGQSATGKKQVEWADILHKIDAYTKTEINSFFSGQSASGKKQVEWSNVLNKGQGWYELAPLGTEIRIPEYRTWYAATPPRGTGWIRLRRGLIGPGQYNEGLLGPDSLPGWGFSLSGSGNPLAPILDTTSPLYGVNARLTEETVTWAYFFANYSYVDYNIYLKIR